MRRYVPYLFILVLLPAIIYANALPNGLHFDDYHRVFDNPGIQKFMPFWRHFVDHRTMSTMSMVAPYRPFVPLSLSVNYAIAGSSLAGYHVGNILFQVAASIVLFFLLLELLSLERLRVGTTWLRDEATRRYVALAIALLFTIHPVTGISVNYISGRDLLLMQFFLLASLLTYVRMRRLGWSWPRWSLTLLALICSLLSKENSLVAPAIIFLFEITLGKRQHTGLRHYAAACLRALPFFVVAFTTLIYSRLIVRSSLPGVTRGLGGHTRNYWTYPLTQAKAHLFHYIPNFLWPFQVRIDPAMDAAASITTPTVLLGLIFILGTLLAAFILRKRTPLLSFSIFSYWTLMLPTSAFLPLFALAVDYRPYPSSPFFFLALSLLALRFVKPRILAFLSLVIIVSFGAVAVNLNRVWLNDTTLWSFHVKRGGSAMAHHNLAMSLADAQLRRKHLEEAVRLEPNYIFANINLGSLLIDSGEVDKGLVYVKKAVQYNPTIGRSLFWMSRIYTQLGRHHEARIMAAKAVRKDVRNHRYLYEAASTAMNVGDYRAALRYLRGVLSTTPNYREAHFLRGFALQKLGNPQESMKAYRTFLRYRPRNYQAHFNLGLAFKNSGECWEAIKYFRRTLSLNPRYLRAHKHLALCFEELGNWEAADEHRRASGMKPK